jgi:hypothetical protein
MLDRHLDRPDGKPEEKPDEAPEGAPEGATDGGRWLRRLGREEFSRLMGASIELALERRGGIPPGEARKLRWEAMRRFSALLQARTRRVRALTRSEHVRELEKTHGLLLRERARQGVELVGIQRELAEARGNRTEAVLTTAEEAALGAALAADLRALLASATPEAAIADVLARERTRRAAALAVAVARERERIDMLERRLAKLRKSQVEMELAMAELARRAQLDGGLPSIYNEVQGLAANALEREAKSTMLRSIFEQNLLLQKPAETGKKTA